MLKKLPHYKGKEIMGKRFDIVSSEDNPIVIPAFFASVSYSVHRQLIRTGLEIAVEADYGIMIQGVSGLCHTAGITLISPFILTSENYGELKVVLVNLGAQNYTIFPGSRVAEAIVFKLGGVK